MLGIYSNSRTALTLERNDADGMMGCGPGNGLRAERWVDLHDSVHVH